MSIRDTNHFRHLSFDPCHPTESAARISGMGSTLDGVTTACVLFLFTCLVIPRFIKNTTQYYAAFGAILGIILMNTLQLMFHNSTGFQVFGGVVIGFLQLIAVSMLVLCAGGMSVKTLAGEMTHAYEVIRRGEEEKEIIIPLGGAQPRPRETEAPTRINLETPTPPPAPQQTPKPTGPSGLPLE
jgi:hypothetical protein